MSELDNTIDSKDAGATIENWKLRCYLGGPSGSGKTTSALTIPPYYGGIKKPRLLIDFDGRYQSAAGLDDLKILSIFEPDTKSPRAYTKIDRIRKELWALARKGEKEFPYSCIIEDGGTMLGRYCMNMAVTTDPLTGLGGAPARQHYIPHLKFYADHILMMKELPCHYIFTGHLEIVENPADESVIYLPKVMGKTARTELAGWFDETYFCQRKDGEKGLDYTWITKGTGKLDFFKSTLNLRGEFWEDPVKINLKTEKTGFADLLERRFGKDAWIGSEDKQERITSPEQKGTVL